MSVVKKKIVVIGDPCGKTSLIKAFVTGDYKSNFVPSSIYDYEKDLEVDGKLFKLSITDTISADHYSGLRSLSYSDTDVCLLCLAVDSTYAKRIERKWLTEIKSFCPETPILLVGTKSDLRNSAYQKLISVEEGKALAKKIGAVDYMECSAKTKFNLDLVFSTAVTSTLK